MQCCKCNTDKLAIIISEWYWYRCRAIDAMLVEQCSHISHVTNRLLSTRKLVDVVHG